MFTFPYSDGLWATFHSMVVKLRTIQQSMKKARKVMTELYREVDQEDHILGPEAAPITLLEYGDCECVHCGRAYTRWWAS